MSQKLKKLQADIAALKQDIRAVNHAFLDDAGIASRVDDWLDQQSETVAAHFLDIATEFSTEKASEGGATWTLFNERLPLRKRSITPMGLRADGLHG